MKRLVIVTVVAIGAATGVCAIVGCSSDTAPEVTTHQSAEAAMKEITSETSVKTGHGMIAVERAAKADKYLFALFWKEKNAQTTAMRKALAAVMKTAADRADSVEVNVTDSSEKPIVDKFDLDRAPMPLILALAPNGAITGGFPTEVDEQSLLEAFATPCTAECMKFLQENKLVFLCVQNATTQSNDAAMDGVRRFKADPRFAQTTEIVRLDPKDEAEAEFLADLQVDPGTGKAATVFLAPPGTPLAMYEGATDKDEFVSTLQKSGSCGAGGAFGPGGCAPQ